MTELFAALFAFPTAIYTILLGIVALYWVFVIAGALELDALDGLHGATHSADAATGASLDAAHAHFHHAIDGDPTLLDALGIRGVPLTVWLSAVVLFAWGLTFGGMQLVGDVLARWTGNFAGGAIVALIATALAVALAAVAVRPLRRFSVVHGAVENRSLVGKVCTVTTLRVDGGFGQAEVADGGAGLLVQVRSVEPNELTRGSEALIFDYDAESGVFHVARFDDAADARAAARRLRTP